MSPPEHSSASLSELASMSPAKAAKLKDDDLSEEDLALNERLELYMLRGHDPNPGVEKLTLEGMRYLLAPDHMLAFDMANNISMKWLLLDNKIYKYCDLILMSIGYAGEGNVLKVQNQNLLGIGSEYLEKGPSVLGIDLFSTAENLGFEMAL